MTILIFFVLHWQLSVFFQSFYLHRYSAHRQFSLTPGWERFFHLMAYLCMGSSYLTPRTYAVLHRMHHAFSDTHHDPHSPHHHGNVLRMMWETAKIYNRLGRHRDQIDPRFEGGYPEWKALDDFGEAGFSRLMWGALYVGFYALFATEAWMFALIPLHFVMGPLHGAIVNWCGHKYGYRNFPSHDQSRNTLVFDLVCAGELFQNNHHHNAKSPNFAMRRFEMDPTYQVMRLFHHLGILRLNESKPLAAPLSEKVS